MWSLDTRSVRRVATAYKEGVLAPYRGPSTAAQLQGGGGARKRSNVVLCSKADRVVTNRKLFILFICIIYIICLYCLFIIDLFADA